MIVTNGEDENLTQGTLWIWRRLHSLDASAFSESWRDLGEQPPCY